LLLKKDRFHEAGGGRQGVEEPNQLGERVLGEKCYNNWEQLKNIFLDVQKNHSLSQRKM